MLEAALLKALRQLVHSAERTFWSVTSLFGRLRSLGSTGLDERRGKPEEGLCRHLISNRSAFNTALRSLAREA